MYAKKGFTVAAGDARSTTEVEDAKRNSGGVVAVKKDVASVGEGLEDKRRENFAEMGELERWTSKHRLSTFIIRKARNEALTETIKLRTRDTPYPWLTACDANMGPEAFLRTMHVVQ